MGKYDDIINMPHHRSTKHPHMSMIDRAAQFSPFAALTGHDAAIKETARLTDEKLELTEGSKATIDAKLQTIMDAIRSQPEITVTYFKPDERKKGGAYLQITRKVKKIDAIERTIVFTDRSTVPIEDILDIECELFRGYDF